MVSVTTSARLLSFCSALPALLSQNEANQRISLNFIKVSLIYSQVPPTTLFVYETYIFGKM